MVPPFNVWLIKKLPLGECSLELLSGLEDSGEGLALPNLLSLSSLIPDDLKKIRGEVLCKYIYF